MAAGFRGHRSRGCGNRRCDETAHAALGGVRASGDPGPRVRTRRTAVPALRHGDRGAWAGGREPHDVLVSGVPEVSRLRRVGHKGADLIAPGNTFASFDAAVEAGVDMIEFDVLREEHGDQLILAHDWADAARRESPHTLEEALAHFASEAFAGVELNVDLKLPGYEVRVLEGLRAFGLLDRALISTQQEESLALLRAAEPGVRLGWSVPKLTRDPFRSRATRVPAFIVLQVFRALLPERAARAIRARRCDALMAHWRLVT